MWKDERKLLGNQITPRLPLADSEACEKGTLFPDLRIGFCRLNFVNNIVQYPFSAGTLNPYRCSNPNRYSNGSSGNTDSPPNPKHRFAQIYTNTISYVHSLTDSADI